MKADMTPYKRNPQANEFWIRKLHPHETHFVSRVDEHIVYYLDALGYELYESLGWFVEDHVPANVKELAAYVNELEDKIYELESKIRYGER